MSWRFRTSWHTVSRLVGCQFWRLLPWEVAAKVPAWSLPLVAVLYEHDRDHRERSFGSDQRDWIILCNGAGAGRDDRYASSGGRNDVTKSVNLSVKIVP